jgi:hypothetical protein
MIEQPDNTQEAYRQRHYDYQRSITSVAHLAFWEVLGGTYTKEQRARLMGIAFRLNTLDHAAGNLLARNITPEPLANNPGSVDAYQDSVAELSVESSDTPELVETFEEVDFFTVNIPRADELKEMQAVQKKLEEQAEISFRGKVKAVIKMLTSLGIDLQAEAVDFPAKLESVSNKTSPLKTTSIELVKLGYATEKEIQTNQMDLYALVTMLLLRGRGANLISGITDGKRILRTEVASRNVIVDEVNRWLIDARSAEG